MNASLTLRLFCAFLMVFVLSILPAPVVLTGFRPPWLCMLVLYVLYLMPNYFRFSFLLFIGLCQDVLLSTVLGEHALALLLITWIAQTKSRLFNFYSVIQQMGWIGLFCLIYQSILLLINMTLGFQIILWTPLASSAMAVFFWPWMRLLLDDGLVLRVGSRMR